MPFLSLLLGLFSTALLIDRWLFGGGFYAALPEFTVSAAAFAGFIIAFLWYRDASFRTKAKAKRPKSLAIVLMVFTLILCIAGCIIWLSGLL